MSSSTKQVNEKHALLDKYIASVQEIHPPKDKFNVQYENGMFIKVCSASQSLPILRYLLLILDPTSMKKALWPLFDTKMEAEFRKICVSIINSLSDKRPEIQKVKMVILVQPYGMKFIDMLLQLSCAVLKDHLNKCKNFKGNLALFKQLPANKDYVRDQISAARREAEEAIKLEETGPALIKELDTAIESADQEMADLTKQLSLFIENNELDPKLLTDENAMKEYIKEAQEMETLVQSSKSECENYIEEVFSENKQEESEISDENLHIIYKKIIILQHILEQEIEKLEDQDKKQKIKNLELMKLMVAPEMEERKKKIDYKRREPRSKEEIQKSVNEMLDSWMSSCNRLKDKIKEADDKKRTEDQQRIRNSCMMSLEDLLNIKPFQAPKEEPFQAPKKEPFQAPKEEPFQAPKENQFSSLNEVSMSPNSSSPTPIAHSSRIVCSRMSSTPVENRDLLIRSILKTNQHQQSSKLFESTTPPTNQQQNGSRMSTPVENRDLLIRNILKTHQHQQSPKLFESTTPPPPTNQQQNESFTHISTPGLNLSQSTFEEISDLSTSLLNDSITLPNPRSSQRFPKRQSIQNLLLDEDEQEEANQNNNELTNEQIEQRSKPRASLKVLLDKYKKFKDTTIE